jgi:hypothetical protein
MRSFKYFLKTCSTETITHPLSSGFPRKHPAQRWPIFFILPVILGILFLSPVIQARDYLTGKEIELLQETRSVANRTRTYMEAAALRLKTALDKLSNKEYEAGDPMEFLLPEDVVDDYCKILHSVQLNVGYAVEAPRRPGNETVEKALKTMKEETEKALRSLEILQRIAKEKQRDPLSERIQDALDTTQESFDEAKEKLAALFPKNLSTQ